MADLLTVSATATVVPAGKKIFINSVHVHGDGNAAIITLANAGGSPRIGFTIVAGQANDTWTSGTKSGVGFDGLLVTVAGLGGVAAIEVEGL